MQLDLGVILGTSEPLSGRTFEEEKSIAERIISKYTISTSQVLVGAIVYGSDAKIVFRLKDFTNKTALLQQMRLVKRSSVGNNLLQALQVARDQFFGTENGGRKDSAKSLIVFVDAGAKLNEKIEAVSNEIKSTGIKIITIEMGPPTGRDSISSLATNEKNALVSPSEDDVAKVADRASDLAVPGKYI